MITMLIRMQHEGVVYFDDISFGLAETGNRFELYSTRTFCYTEDEFGTAVADVNTAFYPVEENSTIEFALKDGETVLDSATLPAAQEVIWNFDINAMPEELKAYTLEATYKDAAGNPIGDKQENVCIVHTVRNALTETAISLTKTAKSSIRLSDTVMQTISGRKVKSTVLTYLKQW